MRDSRFRHGAVIVPDLAFHGVIAASVKGVPGEIIIRPVGIAAAVAEIPADVEGVVDAGVGGIGAEDLRNVDHSCLRLAPDSHVRIGVGHVQHRIVGADAGPELTVCHSHLNVIIAGPVDLVFLVIIVIEVGAEKRRVASHEPAHGREIALAAFRGQMRRLALADRVFAVAFRADVGDAPDALTGFRSREIAGQPVVVGLANYAVVVVVSLEGVVPFPHLNGRGEIFHCVAPQRDVPFRGVAPAQPDLVVPVHTDETVRHGSVLDRIEGVAQAEFVEGHLEAGRRIEIQTGEAGAPVRVAVFMKSAVARFRFLAHIRVDPQINVRISVARIVGRYRAAGQIMGRRSEVMLDARAEIEHVDRAVLVESEGFVRSAEPETAVAVRAALFVHVGPDREPDVISRERVKRGGRIFHPVDETPGGGRFGRFVADPQASAFMHGGIVAEIPVLNEENVGKAGIPGARETAAGFLEHQAAADWVIEALMQDHVPRRVVRHGAVARGVAARLLPGQGHLALQVRGDGHPVVENVGGAEIVEDAVGSGQDRAVLHGRARRRVVTAVAVLEKSAAARAGLVVVLAAHVVAVLVDPAGGVDEVHVHAVVG